MIAIIYSHAQLNNRMASKTRSTADSIEARLCRLEEMTHELGAKITSFGKGEKLGCSVRKK